MNKGDLRAFGPVSLCTTRSGIAYGGFPDFSVDFSFGHHPVGDWDSRDTTSHLAGPKSSTQEEAVLIETV